MQLNYLLRLAWKDAWKKKLSLSILSTCCIVGTAALLAITSLKDNISDSVEENAKTILGADFVISSRHAPDEKTLEFLSNLEKQLDTQLERAEVVSFASMVLFEKSENTRLLQIIGVTESYPLYGTPEVSPPEALTSLLTSGNALLDGSLETQYDLKVGDFILLGKKRFVVKGFIYEIPGSTEIRSAVAPRIFIPLSDILSTELVRQGSVVRYKYLFRSLKDLETKFIKTSLDKEVAELSLSLESYEERGEKLERNLSIAYHFFDICTLLSFLLGGLGVATGAYVYYQNKKTFLETLFYLGLNRRQTIYLLGAQIILFGSIGTIVGMLFGIGIQIYLPTILSSITPVPIPFSLSWDSIVFSLLNGLFSLFAFSYGAYLFANNQKIKGYSILRLISVVLLLLVSLMLGAYFISKRFIVSLIYVAACIAVFMGITMIAYLLRVFARRTAVLCSSFSLKQGIRNLYRPNNQTLTLLVAIGISTFSILFIILAEDLSVAKLTLLDSEKNANILLFDVQEDQLLGLRELMQTHHLPVLAEVPVVQMRISRINSISVQEIRNNPLTKESIPEWVLTREYRSSYREKLDDSEKIVEGKYVGTWNGGITSRIPISVEEGMMKKLGLKLNDTLSFSVQGVEIETYVSSVRQVNWQQLKPNFFMLFPEGALNGAPFNIILLSRYESASQNATFQRSLVTKFGNISAIDLQQILKTLDNVTAQLKSALLFLTLLLVVSALVILMGIIWGSRSARIEENILLRTLGAKAGTIRGILYTEYAVLSVIGVIAGLIFSIVGIAILATYLLQMPLILPWFKVIGICLIIILIVSFLGVLGSLGTIKRPALESFRLLEG